MASDRNASGPGGSSMSSSGGTYTSAAGQRVMLRGRVLSKILRDHGPDTGVPGKTEFPAGWDDARVRGAIQAAIENAEPFVDVRDGSRHRVIYEHRGADRVRVRAAVEPTGRTHQVVTAFPIDGPGVKRNP